MTTTERVLLVLAWLATGLIASIVMMRRGHRHWYWLLLGVPLGPLAFIIFRERSEADVPRIEQVRRGLAGPGLHVLVGIDGSPESERAAVAALDLLGGAVGRLSLASVIDYDADPGAGGLTESAAGTALAAAAGAVGRLRPDEAILVGPPVDALLAYASEEEADLVVVGPRGRGVGKRILGSVATGLVSSAHVPVLVIGDPLRARR